MSAKKYNTTRNQPKRYIETEDSQRASRDSQPNIYNQFSKMMKTKEQKPPQNNRYTLTERED